MSDETNVIRKLSGLIGVVGIGAFLLVINAAPRQVRSAVPSARATQPAVGANAFETDGFLDEKWVVLVRPIVESDVTVLLRARQAGVLPGSLQARVYGLKVDVLFKDAEIGTAFMRRAHVYHLGLRNDQIVVDETYYYCNGFLSTDIVKITEKNWSRHYATDAASIAELDTLAEALSSRTGHQDAFNAADPVRSIVGGLLGRAGEQEHTLERDVTWFAGRQLIEGVGIELTRTLGVGNRVGVRFVR
jgi:hypothetical protein